MINHLFRICNHYNPVIAKIFHWLYWQNWYFNLNLSNGADINKRVPLTYPFQATTDIIISLKLLCSICANRCRPTLVLRKCKVLALLYFPCFRTKSLSSLSCGVWQAVNISALRGRKTNNKYKSIKGIEQIKEFVKDKINNSPLYIILYSQYLFFN